MELKITISDVDYDSLARILLPMLRERLDGTVLGRLGVNEATAAGILRRLPQEKKDALLAAYVNRNKAKVIATLQDAARLKGVGVTIDDVRMNT